MDIHYRDSGVLTVKRFRRDVDPWRFRNSSKVHLAGKIPSRKLWQAAVSMIQWLVVLLLGFFLTLAFFPTRFHPAGG
jgi:hypothetical protein